MVWANASSEKSRTNHCRTKSLVYLQIFSHEDQLLRTNNDYVLHAPLQNFNYCILFISKRNYLSSFRKIKVVFTFLWLLHAHAIIPANTYAMMRISEMTSRIFSVPSASKDIIHWLVIFDFVYYLKIWTFSVNVAIFSIMCFSLCPVLLLLQIVPLSLRLLHLEVPRISKRATQRKVNCLFFVLSLLSLLPFVD